MRTWYAVALFVPLALWILYVIASGPHDQYLWVLLGLPIVWAVLLVIATRAASFLSSARVRAGVEGALVVWTALGVFTGLVGGALPSMVDGGPRRETLMQDTVLWFGVGALVALIPAIVIGALVAFAMSRAWINHISPFKRPLGI